MLQPSYFTRFHVRSPDMAGLNDLPNEIIIMMILLVLPDDLESFGNTSSTVHAVAKPYLSEHRKLKEQYFQTDCSGSGSQLFQLLNEVLMQPRLAFFVNEILLDGWSHIWQDRRPLSEMDKDERAIVHAPYNEEDMVRLRKAVADNVPQGRCFRNSSTPSILSFENHDIFF